MRAACLATGSPERAFEVVHVAGTNGKGSVSAMVESIARVHGIRTGLFTSPHLARFAERIRIDGRPMDDPALAELLVEALDRAPDVTFFETATLAAFLAFREAKVELAILEVGLGGRLDATNVVPTPRAAAITRIAFDHTDRLGTTLDAIAREKAGIAKPGLEILLGPLQSEARAAIDDVARAARATTRSVPEDEEATRFVQTATLGLAGEHQKDNAAIAYLLGASLGATVKERAQGLASVEWPGRLETVRSPQGDVLFDAAHNPDGVESLARYVAALGKSHDSVALVFGVLADKPWVEMVDRAAPMAAHRFYACPSGRAAVDPVALDARHSGRIETSAREAYAHARAAVGAEGLVVVCGSILLVGEVRAAVLGLRMDPPVAM
jgi:dihydrofolate synthase / folylpolyglutamate synthase